MLDDRAIGNINKCRNVLIKMISPDKNGQKIALRASSWKAGHDKKRRVTMTALDQNVNRPYCRQRARRGQCRGSN